MNKFKQALVNGKSNYDFLNRHEEIQAKAKTESQKIIQHERHLKSMMG